MPDKQKDNNQNSKQNFFVALAYWSINRETFHEVQDLIAEENYHCFACLCQVGTFFLSILTFICWSVHTKYNLNKYLDAFISFAGVLLIFTLIFAFYLKNHRQHLTIMCYVVITALLTLAIIIGPVLDSETLSTTFFILLFIIALLIIDLPGRLAFFFFTFGIVFCCMAVLHKDEAIYIYDLMNCAVFVPASIIIGVIFEKRRIEHFRLQRQIEIQRDTDGLTGLYARAAGEREIEKIIQNSLGHEGFLVIADLDDFKSINDTYGHQAGDIILSAVSNSFAELFGKSNILMRYGGDEIVIFLPSISQEQISEQVGRARTRLAQMTLLPGRRLTASFGAAAYPADGDDFQTLFAKADKALYAAKSRGKDNYCLYQ